MAKNLKDIYVGVKKDDTNRRENDFYATPPLATFCLLKNSNVPKNIIEPCAGRGNISIELQRNGHNVLSRDLNTYDNCHCDIDTSYDALELEKIDGYDGVVTNPPYFSDLPRKMNLHFIDKYDYVAMLVRLTYLEGTKRHKLFNKHKPSSILIFSDRLKFGQFEEEPVEQSDQIGGMICYCWVIFDKNNKNQHCDIKWIMASDYYDEWRNNYDGWKKC